MVSLSSTVPSEPRLAHFGAIALMLWPAIVGAQSPLGAECAVPRVWVDGLLEARWVKPVVALCEALGSMPDADPTAALRIASIGDDLLIEAKLSDGRITQRRLKNPEDLLFTVEALVLLPQPEPQPSAAASASPAPATHLPPAPAHLSGSVHTSARRSQASTSEESGLTHENAAPDIALRQGVGVEIGAGISGRLSRAPTYLALGAELYAGIRPALWLFALGLRWEPAQMLVGQATPRGFEMGSVAVGFTVGRRALNLSGFALDAGVSSFFNVEKVRYLRATDGVERSDSDADVRFGATLRALLGRPSAFRLSPSIEADASPLRLKRAQRAFRDLPTLPSWSIAVAMGAVFEEP